MIIVCNLNDVTFREDYAKLISYKTKFKHYVFTLNII